MTIAPSRWLTATLLVLAVVLAFGASRILWAQQLYSRAELEASFWGQGDYMPASAQIDGAFSDIEQALALQPGQPDYLLLHAHMLLWKAYWSQRGAGSRADLQLAIERLLAAGAQRPGHLPTWERLVREKQRMGQDDKTLALARSRLRLLSSSPPAI